MTAASQGLGERFVRLADEAQALYAIRPMWQDEGIFEEGHTRLEDVLPSGGSLRERMQDWMAYNRYLGNSKSRIEINTDLPMRVSVLPGLIAHEGYPGHQTDLSIKEKKTRRFPPSRWMYWKKARWSQYGWIQMRQTI